MDKTKQKIMDTSLKIFAEKGYTGATTKSLAEEAGFSEMTLFRKFKTKENLFMMVLIDNREKFMDDFDSIFSSRDFENPEEFFRYFMEKMVDLIDSNFELISIAVHGDSKLFPTMKGTNQVLFSKMGEYLKDLKIFEDMDVDMIFFSFNVVTFSYFIVLDKHRGRNSINREKLVEEFINFYSRCL